MNAKRLPPDKERSQRQLLDTGIRLFARRGFHGVSVEDIADACGLSKRMPYYYFGSKQGLYRAVLVEIYRRIGDVEFHVVDSALSPSEKLAGLLEGYFKFLTENSEFTQLVLWGNLEKGRRFPKGILTKLPLLQRMRQIIAEGVAAGEFRSDLDASHLLINVMGLCFIYFSNRFSLSEALNLDLSTPQEHDRALRQVKSVLLDGVRAHRMKEVQKVPSRTSK